MNEERCLTCKYCELTPDAATSGEGVCHFNPPNSALVPGPAGLQVMMVATLVKLTQSWCAHHEVQLVKPASTLQMVRPEQEGG